MTLHDQVAIVTGASRGIGREIALVLARAGAHVVCAARSSNDSPSRLGGTVEETAREIEALGQRAVAIACDVSDEAQVAAMVERTMRELSRIDLLVNNAAVNVRAPFAETTAKQWDLVMRVNLRSAFLCSKALLPHMAARGGGHIINISSGAAVMPAVSAELGIIPYAVSKAAIESLTQALAAELRVRNIAVNCLRIESAVATEGAHRVAAGAEVAAPWIEPSVVADAVGLLAVRGPEYTGHIVTVPERAA